MQLTPDGSRAYIALGPANWVAEVDARTYKVLRLYLVGQRVWHVALSPDARPVYTANGNSNDASVIDLAQQTVLKAFASDVPRGELWWRRDRLRCERTQPHFRPRVSALRGVVLHREGILHSVLLGPNGAGKTTLISLATGLYSCQRGRIDIFGHDLRSSPLPALARLGVVFQAPTLDLDLSVIENLIYHAALHGLSSKDARQRAAILLGEMGLGARMRDKVRALSGGMKRRGRNCPRAAA